MQKENIYLNINPEIVKLIISSAREFQAKEGVTFPEEMASSEYEYDMWQILADHKDDLTFIETKKMMRELDEDQKINLLALMYLGRGDYDVNEWNAARKEAENNLKPRLAEYLFSKPQLPEYLEEGLEALGYSLGDVE